MQITDFIKNLVANSIFPAMEKYTKKITDSITGTSDDLGDKVDNVSQVLLDIYKEKNRRHQEANSEVVQAIREIQIPEVKVDPIVSLPDGVFDPLIRVFQEELAKIEEREIVINTDLSGVENALSKVSDQSAVVDALKNIENRLPELKAVPGNQVDYSQFFQDIVDKMNPVDLSKLDDIIEAIHNIPQLPLNKDGKLAIETVKWVGGGGVDKYILDSNGNRINPATEETLKSLAGFSIPAYDNIVLTYVTAGNGLGKIQTATYSLNSVSVAVLTITYDSSNRISTVTKS
jgi:hypothetical protein